MQNPYVKQLVIIAIVAVLTALLAKTQMQLPVVKQQFSKDITLSKHIARQKVVAQEAHKKLSQHFLVEQNKMKSSQKSDQWQLHGIIKTGKDYFALIKQQAKIARYQVGDTLLNDSTMIAIHANGISVSTAGKTEEYRLYQE